MKLNVKVVRITLGCIRLGRRGSADCCPVALGMARAGIPRPNVYNSSFNYGPESRRGWGTLSEKVCEFVQRFDAGKPVKPFSFRVRF